MQELKIEYLTLDKLKPYDKNARKHQEADLSTIKASITEFGMSDPIGVWGKDNVIVEGHGRYLACKELGIDNVPVIHLDHLTDEQRRAYALAHNKTAEMSEWDIDLLGEELDGIFDIDMSDFGFDLSEDEDDETEVIEDEVPQEVEPVAKMGDIYQLGNHRLMCGDSTSVTDVEKLMDGNKADMVFTDPPYNMNYCGAGFINEQNKNVKERIKHIINFDANSISYLAKNQIANNIFIFTSKDLIKQYLDIFDGWNFNMLMRHKTNTPPMVNNNYFADTEYCLYFHKGKRIWNNGLKPIDIYKKYFVSGMHEGRKGAGNLHPTMKPIEFIANQVKICSNENGNVLDIFGGSGSTLIACEQLDRNCYMMELDPKYVDVIIARWEQFTGQKAVLLNG